MSFSTRDSSNTQNIAKMTFYTESPTLQSLKQPVKQISASAVHHFMQISDSMEATSVFEPVGALSSSRVEWKTHNGFLSTKLENGLKVVLKQSSVEPVVQAQVVYNFGSNSEIGDVEAGLAHICEHMIFKGTIETDKKRVSTTGLHLSETDITAIARLLGARYNAYTTTNCTSYHFQSCPEFHYGFLKILAASMFDSKLDNNHLRSEKKAVLAEMAHGKDSVFRDALIEARKLMYPIGTPQRYPTIGKMRDIVDLDHTTDNAETLRNFYNRLYKPENATLFVVGDLSDEDLENLKTKHIQHLFEHKRNQTATLGPVSDKRTETETKEPLEHCFHTLARDACFMLVSMPVLGGKEDAASKQGFTALDTLLFDGEKARLSAALVGSNDIGVLSVGGFAHLDNDFGEYHVVLQGKAKEMRQNVEVIVARIKNAFENPLNKTELKECESTIQFQRANQEINIEKTTQGWIDDYVVTKNLDNFWVSDKDRWLGSLKSRMSEVKQCFEDQNHHTLFYQGYKKEECAAINTGMKERVESARQLLESDAYRRRTELEPPAAFPSFKERFNAVECSFPREPCMSTEGVWTHVSDPQFQFVKAAVRPRQHAKMQESGDDVTLSLLSDIMSKALASQEVEFKVNGVRGASSPLLAVAATCNPQNASTFKAWVDTFASQLSEPVQQQLIDTYAEHKEMFHTKWKGRVQNARMDSDALIEDYISKTCSDNYFVNKNGFTDSFQMLEQKAASFHVGDAIQIWNQYWGDTEQLITQSTPSACDFEAAEVQKVMFTQPRSVPTTAEKAVHEIKVNPDIALNQSIVTIARKGTLNKSSLDYWSVRSIAQIIMFSSLGSRLFKLREEKGMFYTASGAFSNNASNLCNGYDFIQAKVNPGTETAMVAVLKKWSSTKMLAPVQTDELLMAKRILSTHWRTMNAESHLTANWAEHSSFFTNFTQTPHTIIQALQSVTEDEVNKYIQQNKAKYTVACVCK